MIEGNNILDIDEASELLKLSKTSVYKLTSEGRIPATKIGRSWRFHKRLLEEWLIKEMEKDTQNAAKKRIEEEFSALNISSESCN